MWGVAKSTSSSKMHERLAYTFPTVSRMRIRIDPHYLALLDPDPNTRRYKQDVRAFYMDPKHSFRYRCVYIRTKPPMF